MKQIVQNRKTGELRVEDMPVPALRPNGLLVQNAWSLISAGTERTSVDLGKKSLIGKARARPDQVRKVMDTVRREGARATYRKVMGTLDSSHALGYSSAGTVVEMADGISGFSPGDRVACAGAGYANHAELVFVPHNLCVRIPDQVAMQDAAFTTVGAIAMQGVRQAQVAIGENVAVIGLGLVGQLTVQILRAAGCRVLGIDLNPDMIDLALGLGMEQGCIAVGSDVEQRVRVFTHDVGVDAAIITAGSASSVPVEMAGAVCRDRGRVVVVGAVRMDIPRAPFYEKELSLRLSRSYGPGRYDPVYEEKGIDYPIGYVRWTEKRNMEAFLNLVDERRVKVEQLISHRFKIDDALQAYELIEERKDSIGVLLEYDGRVDPKEKKITFRLGDVVGAGTVGMGLIGAGSFARGTLLPHLSKISEVKLLGVATASGTTANDVARRFDLAYCTADYHELLQDEQVQAVVIATRHNLHASMVVEAVGNFAKAVFVEKPLALNKDELRQVLQVVEESSRPVMVGFNRRFAPLTEKVKEFFGPDRGPLVVQCRINAGAIPATHWIQDPEEGGGRIKGEVCHFLDLVAWLIGVSPVKISGFRINTSHQGVSTDDNLTISMDFSDGSIASIVYTAIGDPAFAKERIEVFGDGKVAVIDDFRKASFSHNGKVGNERAAGADKGHRSELEYFIQGIRGEVNLSEHFRHSVMSTWGTLKLVDALEQGGVVEIGDPWEELL